MFKNVHLDRTWILERIASLESYGQSTHIKRLIFRLTVISLLVALGYYVGSKVGFFLTPVGRPIATYWPPNAILLAAFLVLPPRFWWPPVAAVLGAHLVVQWENGIPFGTAFGWFIGNTSEALLGALFLYRFSRRKSLFNSVKGTLTFLLLGAFLAPFLTSFLDAAVVVITNWGRDYWVLWMTRLFSNMLAAITLVPAIVNFRPDILTRLRQPRLMIRAEVFLLIFSVIFVTALVFGRHNPFPDAVPILAYAPLPLLLWASLRFGAGGLGACVSAMAITSFHYIGLGRGPFAAGSMTENTLFFQLLLLVVTGPLMLLNAVLAERQHTEHKLRYSRNKLIDAQEQERKRIARELHDDIGQRLSLVTLELHELVRTAGNGSPPSGMSADIEALMTDVSSISEATRALSHGLHPVQLEYLGLRSALKNFCREIERKASLNIHLDGENSPEYLDPEVSLCLFRVAQEALHNVVKHSHASSSRVELSATKDRVMMRVTDNGVGFFPEREAPAGLGFVNMKERLRSLGGSIKIISRPMHGTVVEATVPLNHRQHHKAA